MVRLEIGRDVPAVGGQPGEKYDTLSNLETIGGSENKHLLESWQEASETLGQAWSLLCEIRDIELAVKREGQKT